VEFARALASARFLSRRENFYRQLSLLLPRDVANLAIVRVWMRGAGRQRASPSGSQSSVSTGVFRVYSVELRKCARVLKLYT